MKRIRVAGVSVTAATALVAVAALGGCSSGPAGSTASSPGTSTAEASPSSGTSTAAASGTGPGGSATAGSTGTGTTTSSKCSTKDLSLQVLQGAQQEGSTTGSFYVQLTNVSSRTCTLYGFPGVDLIGGAGGTPKPLGMKDVWTVKLAMTGGEKTQTLAPNSASAAFVNFSTRDPGASAGIPRAAEVQVIPPDQTTALTARICNVQTGYVTPLVTTKTLTVGPMDVDGVPHK